jgi:hypothetical protein
MSQEATLERRAEGIENAEELQKTAVRFSEILSDEEMNEMCAKHGVEDERHRKLWVRAFFWLMVFSAGESSRRGSLLQLIGFFLGAMWLLYPEKALKRLSKSAVSKRMKNISWELFRSIYNHLLNKYEKILAQEQKAYLGIFQDAFAVDGSVIDLCKQMGTIFKSLYQEQSSLKLNTKFSLKTGAVHALEVSSGKRHDSQFAFVTKASNLLYLVDLGFWSFKLMQKIIDAHSFFVMRLKSNCDPLIVKVGQPDYAHLVGKRLSEISDFLMTRIPNCGEIDLTVQLSSAKKPHFTHDIRLVGLFHENQWRFYVTNIFLDTFTPKLIFQLYSQRWQIEIFFNIIKNLLSLENIISTTHNGIMIEIYSALIFHLFTLILIALAAQKTQRTIHEFSFERSFKVVQGFLFVHFPRFLLPSLTAVDEIFLFLIDLVTFLGFAQKKHDDFTFQSLFP